jgi:hypothetical protein
MSAAQQGLGAGFSLDSEIEAFEAGDVDPQRFDHEAHVRVAWCYLRHFPTPLAIARFTSALRSLTLRLGVPQKYHETVTWFFMIIIADRRARAPGADWESFRKENRDLMENSAALLKQYYSPERLDCSDARQRFLLPDRAPVKLVPRTGPRSDPSS